MYNAAVYSCLYVVVVVVVVVFFTLTDRASTIPNNTRGCQSGTWSAGQKKIRGTSTCLLGLTFVVKYLVRSTIDTFYTDPS